MSKFPDRLLGLGLLSAVISAPALAQDIDMEAATAAFRQCQGCHQIGPNAKNGFGPELNGTFERGMGAAPSYEYSASYKGMVSSGLVWTDETMDEFLAAPMTYMPGTKMAFPGVSDAEQRKVLIQLLHTVGVDGELPKQSVPVVEAKPEEPRPDAATVPIPEHGVRHLGRVALEEEIAAWDIDVRPDGQGLPPGKGDAIQGAELYDSLCAVCHGVFGEGEGRWPILAGGQGSLEEDRPEKTIGSYWPYLSTVFDYVKRAMPFGNARSLTDNDVYAITAYLMYLNDLVDDDFELSAENFSEVRLPNEEHFIPDDRFNEAHYNTSDERCMSDCKPEPAELTMRAAVLDVTPDNDNENAGVGAID